MTPQERVARNFIKARGMEAFRTLIDMFKRGESGQVIANHFGVSRERVRQWKGKLGETITHYSLYPEVADQLDPQRV